MEHLELTFRANNQCLEATNFTPPLFVASNTVDWIVAKFDLGTNWDCWDLGAVKAIWKFKSQQYSAILNAEGECTVPHEVLGAMTGEVKVNLVASTIEDDEVVERLTTYPLYCINVNKVALVDGDNSVAITPSEYEQFVEDVQEYAQDAYDAKIGAEQAADSALESAGIASDMADTATQAKDYAVQQAQLAVDAKETAQTAQGLAESAKDSAVSAKEDAESARDSAIEAKNAAQGYAQDAESSASRIESLIPTPTEDGKILVTNDGGYEISELVTLTENDHLYGAENTVTRPVGESFVVDVIGNNNTLDGSSARNRMFGADVVIGDGNEVQGETILSVIGGFYNDIDGAYAGTIFGMQNRVKVHEGGNNQLYSTVFGSNNEIEPPQGEWYNDATVFGNALKVGKRGQTLIGVYNEPINDLKAIIVGDGTGENTRHNAVVIKQTNGEYSAKLNDTEITESKLRELKAVMLPTDTASGSIASFPDGADGVPMSSVKASIEPIQDLHGQTSPYPAGGGVNKFDKDTVTIGKWLNLSTGAIEDTTNSYALSDYIPVKSGVNYIFTNPQSSRRWFYDTNKDPVSQISGTNFTASADGYVLLTVSLISADIDTFMFVEGNTLPTTYSPYSNICPISGTEEVVVTRGGINQWDEEWELGIIDVGNGQPSSASNRIRSKNFSSVKGSTSYYFYIGAMTGLSVSKAIAFWYDENQNYITYSNCNNTAVTSPSNARYVKFYCASDYGVTYNHDISINYPSTDHDYHAYLTPLTITTSLGQTVYGGTVDVVSGVLTVEWAMETLDGSEYLTLQSINNYGVANFLYTLQYRASNNNEGLCNRFPKQNTAIAETKDEGFMLSAFKYLYIRLFATTANTVEAFKTWLASNNVQFCYPLATPITIQLTPQEVTSLLGGNTVWADSGSVEVTYKADIQRYIDKKISAVLNA